MANRNAQLDAFDAVLTQVKNTKLTTPVTLVKIAAGVSLALTAGFVGWLFRGGLLISAFLSAMPLWRGFDPLVVIMSRTGGSAKRMPLSDVDLIFDKARRAAKPRGLWPS